MVTAIKNRFGRWLIFSIVLMGSAFATPQPVSQATAENSGITDYDQQAIYMVKMGLTYVEWPTVTTTSDGQKIINVCVLGDSPAFIQSMMKVQPIAAAKKLKINILQNVETAQYPSCNIAYVPKNRSNYKDIIVNMHNLPVLTVSPINGFAASGGVVELAISEVGAEGAPTNSRATVKFIINNKSATSANLKIAPELTDVAEVLR